MYSEERKKNTEKEKLVPKCRFYPLLFSSVSFIPFPFVPIVTELQIHLSDLFCSNRLDFRHFAVIVNTY